MLQHDQAAPTYTLAAIGRRSEELTGRLRSNDGGRIAIAGNRLTPCAQGELMSVPDLPSEATPLARLLADGGMRSMVAVPLVVDSRPFGALLVARGEASGDATGAVAGAGSDGQRRGPRHQQRHLARRHL
jgi:hypothetical protein